MSQPAHLESFVAMVNRLFNVHCKPNFKSAADLWGDCCARERNFDKRFINDQSGSSSLVQQVVLRVHPHFSLRCNNNNTHGKATSASAGSIPNVVDTKLARASAGSITNGALKGGRA
jgi:hypothetical protein